jgi:hypothetical protein
MAYYSPSYVSLNESDIQRLKIIFLEEAVLPSVKKKPGRK